MVHGDTLRRQVWDHTDVELGVWYSWCGYTSFLTGNLALNCGRAKRPTPALKGRGLHAQQDVL